MRIATLLFTSLLMFLFSCGQPSKGSKQAIEFYNLVNKQISLGKPDQQKFIDKLTSSILAIKDNKNTVIDINELQTLFNLAKAINFDVQGNLEKMQEFDTDINYRTLALEYFQSYNNLYQDEMPKAISIFGEKSENRFERVGKLLIPKLKVTKQKELILRQAQKDFETKYETIGKSESKRTGSDFEFVRLKDFKFSTTTVKEGAKIELLSFSGGDGLSDENIYYKQFIGIEKTSGDTLRILALAPMQYYDLDKAFRVGTYITDLPDRGKIVPTEKEFIIFNRNQADIERQNYKTVFGILKFDE